MQIKPPSYLGGLPIYPNSNWADLATIPRIQAQIRAGVPTSASLRQYVLGRYFQRDWECTPNSTAAMQSIFESIATGRWIEFDAHECYEAVGGTGHQGVDTLLVMEYCFTTGLREVNGHRRFRIGTYALQDILTSTGVEAVKAALASDHPCVLAFYPPLDFNLGTSTGQYPDYKGGHQVCLIGYDDLRVYYVNSYDINSGRDMGFGSVPWTYFPIASRAGYAYAYTATDVIDESLSPFKWTRF